MGYVVTLLQLGKKGEEQSLPSSPKGRFIAHLRFSNKPHHYHLYHHSTASHPILFKHKQQANKKPHRPIQYNNRYLLSQHLLPKIR